MPRNKDVTKDGEIVKPVPTPPKLAMGNLSSTLLTTLAKIGSSPVTGFLDVERISTGSLALDWATGGGWARAGFNTIIGDPFGGKTTTALFAARAASKNGYYVAIFDMEGGVNPRWFRRIGYDPEYVHLYQPDTGEKMLAAIIAMVEADAYDLIIIDSIGETVFDVEMAGDVDDAHVGVAARRYRLFIKKVKPSLKKSKTALLVINQLFHKIGGYNPNGSDAATAEYGGRGLQYAPGIKVKMGWPDRKVAGMITFNAKVVKNRTAPLRSCTYSLDITGKAAEYYYFDEVADTGKATNVFTQKNGNPLGAGNAQWWYGETQMTPADLSVFGGKTATKRLHAIAWLSEQEEQLLKDIEREIRRRFESEDYDELPLDDNESGDDEDNSE